MEYIDNMIQIKGNFGNLIDDDMIEYESTEIRIHTPSEHIIDD